jgi:hypothetical protein
MTVVGFAVFDLAVVSGASFPSFFWILHPCQAYELEPRHCQKQQLLSYFFPRLRLF